ncbi:MAG TPA: 1,4-beta-xylanase [Solibacterales bacterium]|nr:1,4-beta-xylanase [Bryobacterales bacterium]
MLNRISRRSILAAPWLNYAATTGGRWSAKKAKQWYARLPWLVGANYTPASAINQLEMWQRESFDLARIETELGWASGLGMNTMRVFLHNLLWENDRAAFVERIDRFLGVCATHRIRPMFVVYDSVWHPQPKWGTQRAPTPGVHNSYWVQSPGAEILASDSLWGAQEDYVRGIIGRFRDDSRILAWDLWNEPDNDNANSYKTIELVGKGEVVARRLTDVFRWARAAKPEQPLTVGLWLNSDWSKLEKLNPVERISLENSDILSFHNYNDAAEFEKRAIWLKRFGRPVLCTEYMARGNKSTFEVILPVAKKHRVAAMNWGLVQGKTQTHLPWDSWKQPYVDREPAVWFHEVFRADGTLYRPEEGELIRRMTGAK